MMQTVLFICTHNSGRSQIAEAFFNRLAKGRARAISAGSQPDDAVNPVVVETMKEAGIDISRNKPKLLTAEIMDSASRAVTMGCQNACPFTGIPTEDWGLPDPKGQPLAAVRLIRDEIEKRVSRLVREIAGE